MNACYEELFGYIQSLKIIDSHEHLPGREALRPHQTDILREYLEHYFSSDLMAMGITDGGLAYVKDASKPLMERWAFVEPYWELCRNTGYGRALDLAVNALYGIKRIDGSTLEEANAKFQQTLLPGAQHYKKVLKEMSNIEYSILDTDLDCDREYFRSAYNINDLIAPGSWAGIEEVEKQTGIPVTSFGDWLAACEALLEAALQKGAFTLKCSSAYERTLLFENVTADKAQSCFNDLLGLKARPIWSSGAIATTKEFQDYMLHFILRFANRRGLVCQFHTGLQEGNRNYIAHSDPTLLSNLLSQYPDIKFDIFHMGYPYQNVLAAMAKTFPNIYLDMCWAHIISPAACINTLDEWLDSVPVGKIIAFGGDYCLIDGVYAHQYMARQNVAKALAQKVQQGIFDMEQAKWIASRLFYENPKALYEGK